MSYTNGMIDNLEIIDAKQNSTIDRLWDHPKNQQECRKQACMTVQKLFRARTKCCPVNDCSGQVDLPAGQVTFHSHLPYG